MALLTNAAVISFGTVSSGQNITVTHASVTINDGTLTDRLIWTGALAAQRVLVETDPIRLPIGDLDIEIPPGALEDQGITDILNEGIDQYTSFTVRLGTGDMGSAGTGSEPLGATGYVAATGVSLAWQTS